VRARKKGGGLALAKAVVSKVTGQPIDYAVRIDFSGFVKAVDIIGGIDVDVENTFDDFEYPISGKEDDKCGFSDDEIKEFVATTSAETDLQEKFSCRYKHLHFDKGINHMDGETALEFVRSRHALGVESGDFARSKRQQKIITAFRDKIFSAETLINPAKIINLYNVVKGSIDTDIKTEEFDDFIRLAQKMRGSRIQNANVDIGDYLTNRPGLLLEAPISAEYDFLSVLIPRVGNGDYSEIKQYLSCEFSKGDCVIKANSAN
jgi:anionic cell wall polymer biosynthesis LytR-Cps2A-Psr (LCP) family protein